MDFLIPDNILDTLICNFCSNLLSVIPVKVYPGGKRKCGRCVLVEPEEDDGVLSKYNEIANRSIFKCINRFDGCRALLTPVQVLMHEETCQSKQYFCPYCFVNVPTCAMIKHFETEHEKWLLNTQFFFIELGQFNTYFLYRHEDNLFFINFTYKRLCPKNDNFVRISFSFLLLGDLATAYPFKIGLKIMTGETVINIDQVLCESFPSDGLEELRIPLNLNSKLLAVMFTIETHRSKMFIKHLPQQSIEMVKSSKELTWLDSNVRKMHLTDDFKRTFEKMSMLNASTFSATFCGKEIFVTLSCFMCSVLKYIRLPDEEDYINFVFIDNRYYLICLYCSRARGWNTHKLISVADFQKVQFCCKWKCGKYLKADDVYKHEKECKSQPDRPCPVNTCKHSCKLFNVGDHFKQKHTDLSAPFLLYTTYGGSQMNLNTSDSPMKKLLLQSHMYVFVDMIWEEPVWKITLSSPIAHLELRAVVLDNSWNFLGFIRQTGSIRHSSKIFIKCYVPDRKKDEYERLIILKNSISTLRSRYHNFSLQTNIIEKSE